VALGCRARVVTRHGPDFVGTELLRAAGVVVSGGGSRATTAFANAYRGGARTAHLLALGSPLDDEEPSGDVVFYCPVAGEVTAPRPGAGLVAAGLQGWLRRVRPDGVVERERLLDVTRFAPCRVVFLSREDAGEDVDRLVARLRAVVPIVVVTHGVAGSVIHDGGAVLRLPSCPAREVDPTGAGDVYAAAFLVALARGERPTSAGVLATCAAAIAVEGTGPAGLAGLADLPGRMKIYSATMTD
jgi:1D-myo-inositol 3-kinase